MHACMHGHSDRSPTHLLIRIMNEQAYSWRQGKQEAVLTVWCPGETRAKDVDIAYDKGACAWKASSCMVDRSLIVHPTPCTTQPNCRIPPPAGDGGRDDAAGGGAGQPSQCG